MPPTIHAVIVGIDHYPKFKALSTAVRDAQKMSDYFKDELGAEEKNIILLKDGDAKKKNILDAISSVAKNAGRNDAIIFFFSGYASQIPTEDGEKEGILCAEDVLEAGGISDSTLLQLFDQVAKSCGNNITVLLDCPAKIFCWVDPASFVVVAPDTAKESIDGGAFTQAMLTVLKGKSVKTMTVEAFAGHVQATLPGVEVRAIGVNVDRLLFNVKGDRSHYAFIPGRTLSDGRIALDIGLAQGVRVGAIYGIYPGNIKGLERLGSLEVDALDDNCMMATFQDSVNFSVPNFFCAVEENRYFDDIKIFVTRSSDTEADPLAKYSGWTGCTTEAGAALTAKVANDDVSLKWNGFVDDPKLAQTLFDAELHDPQDIQREIRRGARFQHLVGAPAPNTPLISDGLKIRFGKVGVPGDNILDSDSFDGLKTIKLDVKKGRPLGPYSLTLVNNNTHSVWPYIFLCDPERFTIRIWYLPPSGLLKAPLRPNKELVIGGEYDQRSLFFSYRKDRARDYTYMKIFVTMERMDFTAFQQWFTSPAEDQLRGHFKFKSDLITSTSTDISVLQSPGEDRDVDHISKKQASHWASMRLTIFETFIDTSAV